MIVMGFAQGVIGGYSDASQYDAQKRQTLIKGRAAQNEAYAKATASEQASRKNLHLVGENMARVAGNKRREMAAARTAAVASGFALEGSANKQEELVNKAYDEAMGDMARSGSVASMNALNEQIALRRGGDAALRAAEAEAEQYRAMAKISRTGAFMSAVGGVIGAAGGLSEAPAGADWKQLAGHAIQGANGGAGMMNAFNPFMSQYAPEGWDKYYLNMLGIGKNKQ